MRPSMDKDFSVGIGETERNRESSENTGDMKKLKRIQLGADKEMMHAFLSSVEFNPSRRRSKRQMPAMETETRLSTKKRLKSGALNETDFKMVDLGDEHGPNIIGRRVEVYWHDSRRWFRGRVKAFDRPKILHKIDYDNGDKEHIDLKNEVFRMEVYPGETVNIKPESNIKHKLKFPVPKDAGKGNEAEKQAGVGKHDICLGLQEKEGEHSQSRTVISTSWNALLVRTVPALLPIPKPVQDWKIKRPKSGKKIKQIFLNQCQIS